MKPTPLLMLAALALGACGGDEPPNAADDPAAMEQAVAQASGAANTGAGNVKTVSAEALEKRLPERADGLPRVDVTRAETGAMGMTVSTVNARYEDGAGRRISIAISDMGGMGNTGVMGAAAWAMTDFDRTTSDGYERTSRFEGHKAFESLSREGGVLRTELSIVVDNRFIVQLEARDSDMDALKRVAKSLDLRSLADGD